MKRLLKYSIPAIVFVATIVGLLLFPFTNITTNGSVSISMALAQEASSLSAEIEYPPEIKTDYEKLCAVYNLIEQMCLEHNRVGDVALADWSKYEGKYRTYCKVADSKLIKLLEEQNRIKQKIWVDAGWTEALWDELSPEEKDKYFNRIYGEKEILEQLPTEATTHLLDELKNVELDKLSETETPPDPIEDFTGYTEVDNNGWLTVSASKIEASNCSRDGEAYVYKDFGVDHFNDLGVLFEMFIDSSSHGECIGGGPAFANEVDDMNDFGADAVSITARYDDNYYIIRGDYDATDSGSFSNDTLYYFRMERAAGNDTITVKVYGSAADRTNDTNRLDILSLSGFGTSKWRYCYGFVNYDSGADSRNFTGYVQNVDLQEASTPDISNTPSTWSIGTVATSTDYWAEGSEPSWPLDDGECHFAVTNNSGAAVDIDIKGANFTGGVGWTLAGSAGENQVVVKAGVSGAANEGAFTTLTTGDQSFISSLADSGTEYWELMMESATSHTDGVAKSGTVTLTASIS